MDKVYTTRQSKSKAITRLGPAVSHIATCSHPHSFMILTSSSRSKGKSGKLIVIGVGCAIAWIL